MRRYQLGELYHSMRAAVRSSRTAELSRLLGQVLGLALPDRPPPPRLPVTLKSMLSYRGFKPAELAMIAADLKPVVKMEDLPLVEADAFCRRHHGH